VASLVVFAALRVFVFSSAFPFFSPVDEQLHLDLVLKYARGFLPTSEPSTYDPTTAALVMSWGSPEYVFPPSAFWIGRAPTPREWIARRGPAGMRVGLREMESRINGETAMPPLYYAAAALWWRLGGLLWRSPLVRMYWVRWLAAPALGALVFLAWWGLRGPYTDDASVRIGVPALLAAFPNDFFFYVTPDVLAPLLGGAAFLGLLALAAPGRPDRRPPSAWLAAATGLAMAAAFLCKYTGVIWMGVGAALCVRALAEARRTGTLRSRAALWSILWGAALAPTGAWLLRSRLVLGSWTGQQHKVALLGWSPKPLGEWLDHPLLTPHGLGTFLHDLAASFWRGELAWHGQPMLTPGFDGFYAFSSGALLALALLGWLRRRRGAERRRIEGTALGAVAGSVAILAVLSLAFRFGVVLRPSQAYPYFTSGRLAASALMPFALLYVRGLEVACTPAPPRLRRVLPLALLAIVLGAVLIDETGLSRTVFASPFNWFHAGFGSAG
jgi:hypothetical protein